MTDREWDRFGYFNAEIDRLQHDLNVAEIERNYGLARIISDRIRAAELARDQLLSRLGSTLSAAA